MPVKYRKAILDLAYEFYEALLIVHDEVFADVKKEAESEELEEIDDLVIGPNLYKEQVAAGIAYFSKQCTVQKILAMHLFEVLKCGNLTESKAAYNAARPPFEQIETLANSFQEEDREIDARPYAIDGGETSGDFIEFHKVERALYRDEDIAVALKAMPRLLKAIDSLCDKLSNELELFTADSQWKGVLAFVYEVPAKKISLEEETWSDLSIMIFRENAKGIYSQILPYFGVLPHHIVMDLEKKYGCGKVTNRRRKLQAAKHFA